MSEHPSLRLYAALAHALAVTRGQLYSMSIGDYSKEDVDRVLRSTSLVTIAATLGLRESDVAVDWNDFLSREEQDAIAGLSRPNQS
jgi:hypothetical protein